MIETVLNFWFEEVEPAQHWRKDAEFDREIKDRFGDVLNQASACELFHWRETAEGRLAEIIVLDQFSRNVYRGSAQSFANDPLALALAQEAVWHKFDEQLNASQRAFLYMPYMHSESLAVHDVAEFLFKRNGIESNYKFELKHREIIERFGRYPHRNALLGRASSDEEVEFLLAPDSSF